MSVIKLVKLMHPSLW